MRRRPKLLVLLTALPITASIASPVAISSGSEGASELARPSISDLTLTPDSFRVRARIGPHHRLSGGTRISFTLSAAGTVHLGISRRVSQCNGERATNVRGAAVCIHLITGFPLTTLNGHAGHNNFDFSGVAHKRPLAPGRYKLGAVLEQGNRTGAEFTILGPPVHRPRN